MCELQQQQLLSMYIILNIKLKYRHRQNDIYSETLLKSHSFSLLIPSWKCFPALEANSSLFKHNLIQPPTNCFLSSLAEQESSVLVFTCSGEQTAQPGLVCVCEFLGCLLLESTCNTCLSVMMFFPLGPRVLPLVGMWQVLSSFGSFHHSHHPHMEPGQLGGTDRGFAVGPLLWMEKMSDCFPSASCKGDVRASWPCAGDCSCHTSSPSICPARATTRKTIPFSIRLGFPSHSAKRLSQHSYPSWNPICTKGDHWSTGHLVPISKTT